MLRIVHAGCWSERHHPRKMRPAWCRIIGATMHKPFAAILAVMSISLCAARSMLPRVGRSRARSVGLHRGDVVDRAQQPLANTPDRSSAQKQLDRLTHVAELQP